MRFSQRYGYKEVKNKLQIESMDDELRNSIWNILNIVYWETIKAVDIDFQYKKILSDNYNTEMTQLVKRLYIHYFKVPVNSMSYEWNKEGQKITDYFFIEAEWHQVYDFIEFVANNYPNQEINKQFIKNTNIILERELSGYRFIENQITPITDQAEISAITEAAQVKNIPVRDHIKRSLELMSDRKNPDYRNSIKESISAVESLVSIVTGNDKGTLGQLIKKVDEKIEIHESLKQAFSKLYGYTSDESGIRHFLKDKEKVDFEDAKFMLVSCSAFINYVNGKLK